MFTIATIRFWMLSHFGDSIERGASKIEYILLFALIIGFIAFAVVVLGDGPSDAKY
jgi:Flp pilus assembly pilin Flp